MNKQLTHREIPVKGACEMFNKSRKELFDKKVLTVLTIVLVSLICPKKINANWQDSQFSNTLKNKSVHAEFQAGLLYRLTDLRTGQTLIDIDPAQLPAQPAIFGDRGIDLDKCTVKQELSRQSIVSTFLCADGNTWQLSWTLEPVSGDLVSRISAKTSQPVTMLRYMLPECNIADYRLVLISGYGVGQVYRSPWKGSFGDPAAKGYSRSYNHPMVALFQGDQAGWFIEARNVDLGPGNLFASGHGTTAQLAIMQGYPFSTDEPKMFEIRIRTYQKYWQDAVDPYVDWMEKEAGFAPLGTGYHPEWVKDIQTQVYIEGGDYGGLEELAKYVDPKKTVIGRIATYRYHAFDVKYPDYRVAPGAKKWLKRVREMGYHVGVHFNCKCISYDFPELIERFKAGMEPRLLTKQEKKELALANVPDAATTQRYDGLRTHAYCSAALKEWREYFIEQLRDAVESGVDMIYLDQSMGPAGKWIVDGVTGLQGQMLLQEEIMKAYPGVSVKLEQFNPFTARYASFALSQMPLGHPLSGYIFQRFLKVLPESYLIAPIEEPMMDAFANWGSVIPCGGMEPTWLEIAKAFQQYNLVPDSRLPRKVFTDYKFHFSHGWTPVANTPVPPEGEKLFGYRGDNGVTAYFEKHPTKRGFVIYEPNKKPRWVGKRARNTTTWPGPGILLDWLPGGYSADWLIYNDKTMLALDPTKTYLIDNEQALPQDRFHITSVPEDFVLYHDTIRDSQPQNMGNDYSWYKVTFTGHGTIKMAVPDERCVVFLDGKPVEVDRNSKTAKVKINADAAKPSVLLVYKQSDTILKGLWANLPWQRPKHMSGTWMLSAGGNDAKDAESFFQNPSAYGVIVGKLPKTGSIRLKGRWGLREDSQSVGDAVVKINGLEVLQIPCGERPFKTHNFDHDISAYAGQYILLEFAVEGERRFSPTDWYSPSIDIEP
jgi:hypothetical protein